MGASCAFNAWPKIVHSKKNKIYIKNVSEKEALEDEKFE